MIIVGILISAFVAFAIGGLWYGLFFSKPWQKVVNVDFNKNESSSLSYGITLLFEILSASILFLVFYYLGIVEFHKLMITSILIGLFSCSNSIKNYIFEQRNITLILINETYKFIIPIIMTLILSLFI